MSIEIRPARAEEMKAYGKIVSYVFASTDGMVDETESIQPDWTVCGFVDGKMAATMAVFPFTVRLNGAPVKMGGVTQVGTLPQYRRQGLLRGIKQYGFESMRERGQSIAILWASMGAIYQRFGYGLVSTQVNYTFDPRNIAFESGPEPTGAVEIMDREDAWPTVKQLYIQWCQPRNLQIHRATALWEANIFQPRKKGEPLYVGVYRNGDGEATGHIVYYTYEREVHEAGPSQVLVVKDFVAMDMDAYRGLWTHIRRHDLVGRVEMNNVVGEEDPAPDLLLEPRALNRHTKDAIWGRILDIPAALPQRPYGDRGELTFRVEDRMCPWNTGTWLLETDGKTTEVRPTDRSPELTLSMNTLASLLFGHRPASHYHKAGKIDAASARALKTADHIFATEYPPYCSNNF